MIRRHRILISLIAVLALIPVACGDSDTETTAPAAPVVTEPATTVAQPVFALEASVSDYLATIPDGFMAVGDLTAFKDAVETGGALLIDVREAAEYEAGHLPGAVNIPLRTLAANLDKIPMDRQVFIYCQSGYRAAVALSSLRMLGYDNVLSYPPSYKGWTAAEQPVTTDIVAAETFGTPTIEPALFAAVDDFLSGIPEGFLSAGDVTKVKDAMSAGAFMLDVRTEGEWADGHIPGAHHINLRALGQQLSEVPKDTQVITYCKSGHRAALAMAALQVLGYENVKAFPASWKGWVDAGEQIEA